jgi:hypothetical protein
MKKGLAVLLVLVMGRSQMKKGLAVLLVLVMSMGSIAAALDPIIPNGPSGQSAESPFSATQPDYTSEQPVVTPAVDEDPMLDYLEALDPNGPRPPLPPLPGGEISVITNTNCVLLFANDEDEWQPLPSREDIAAGAVEPVSFENASQHEIHGKLFEAIVEENTTYFDDIGIPTVPIEVEFDGTPVAMTPGETGNNTTVIDPFIDTGNGTFQFLLDINKDAGEYELIVHFAGWPRTGQQVYKELTYRAVIYVNHPSLIDVDVTPESVTVGNPITISGSVQDDTGRLITSVGLQVRFDNVLLGPTSDGFYLDDVRVTGADFFDNFEDEEAPEWNTYTAPGRGVANQWMRGSPGGSVGPIAPHSGSNLYGTNLERNYDRGAWSFLVTPRLNFTADQEYILSFWAWWSVYWEEDFAYVMASVDGGSSWFEDDRMEFMGSSLIQPDWTYYEFNVTNYVGSDNVKFAFVFYSIDKTLDVRTDSTYSYQFVIPMTSTADRHRVSVIFRGNLLFRQGQSWEDIDVKRITHFEFELNATKKVGHRNNPVKLVAYLKDNMGEVPLMNIRGHAYFYQATIYWDKTWTIDDGIGERVGPPRTMDRDSGEVSINYVVDPDQILGPANVTFRFPGDDYYTSVQMTDIYYVKAEVYVSLPGKEELQGFRGRALDIHGELRIVPDQSIDDPQLGDPVSGEFIKIFWNNQQIANRRSDFKGEFSVDYLIPSTHELGDVLVMFEYDGQSLYEPVTLYANYTVVSETFISLVDQKVYKGEWVYINGTVKDDKDQPVANMPIYIIWKRAPEIGRATSKTDGTFSLQYYIEYEDKVGNISVIARFKGTKIYLANETTATYTVKVNTILERRDRTFNLIRGQQVQISGKLYEDWGGYRGVEVQREIVTLLIDEIVVSFKRTAFDGSVTFTAPIEPDKFTYGEVNLVLDFNGTAFYEPSRNTTQVVIKANSLLTMSEFRVEGDLFDPNIDVVEKDQETYGRILLQDDNFQPIANGNVTVYYKDEGQRARKRLVSSGLTDSQGFYEFNWTFQVNTVGNKTFIVEYEGLMMDTFLKQGDQVILGSETEYNITYRVPPEVRDPVPWWVYGVVGIVLVAGAIGIVWSSFYYRRRRQLRKMQRIIRRAADRLVAGNVYSATIFRAYREMAHTLRAYGQLRKDSETFREFEDAVRDALPIDADSLDDFLTVLEEARYSEHEIGETQKDTAIEALRGVQNSIEKILLTDDQIAQISRTGAAPGEMIEPEIIVAEETARTAPPKAPEPVPVPEEKGPEE